jgi:hypothetical protein
MKIMYEHVNTRNGKWSPLLADDVYEIIKAVRIHPYPKRSRRCPHFKILSSEMGLSVLHTPLGLNRTITRQKYSRIDLTTY